MSPDAPAQRVPADPTPEQRRRNVVLGSLLAALVLVLMGTWMIIFSRNGFPKDPAEAKRLQAQQQSQQPAQQQPQVQAPTAERPAR